MMDNNHDALVLVFTRNAFYRRLHFLALATFVLSLFVIGTLIGVIIFLTKNPTRPLFFATDSVGRLIKIIPVDQPNMTTEEVAAWTIEAIQAAFSYSHVNFRAELQSAQKYFTNYGWTNYMQALIAKNILNSNPNESALLQRKWIVIGQVVSQPKLITQGLLGGAYAWKFEIPVLMTYWSPPYDDKSKFLNSLQVTVIVQRQPILQSYKGLGIVQVITRFATANQIPDLSTAPPG